MPMREERLHRQRAPSDRHGGTGDVSTGLSPQGSFADGLAPLGDRALEQGRSR